MSVTRTSIQHPNLRCRLHAAMLRATQESKEHRIGVYHAGPILVSHKRDRIPAFKFLHYNRDITGLVLAELRS